MIQSATQYHQHTSYDRHDMSGHYMDWQNQPSVFKEYPGIEPIPLPRDAPLPSEPFSTLFEKREKGASTPTLGLETLSAILLLTHTLTAKARHADGDFYFRSPASAGALYPNEIYVAPKGLADLEDGLYHFSIQHHGLSRLRKGAFSGIENKTLTFFFTAIFFRSAWKYRDRSYRYHLLDAGHLLDDMILALRALQLPFTISYDFDDFKANHLLGLDQTKEVALAMLHIPQGADDAGSVQEEIPGLAEEFQKASRVSGNEIDYPAVREMHEAGASSRIPEEPPRMVQKLGIDTNSWDPIPEPTHSPETIDYPEALFRRRSKRNFIQKPIPRDSLYRLLHTQCAADPEGSEKASYQHAVCTGFIIGNAEGMEPGLYLLDPLGQSTGMVTSGTLLKEMAHICLDQMWLENAGIHFLYMTNMGILDQVWGARGYRYAMLTAGRLGQRLYIAATSMGLGCCGIGALYDGEAAQLLGLNKPSRLLYLVALGQVKKV